MIKTRMVAAGALLAVASAANAGSFSVTPTIASDYDFRGISQTDEDPAFQLGATYNFDNGFYVGAWGSNVDFGAGDPDVEIDYFAGYAAELSNGVGYDVGVNYYSYPGANGTLGTYEVYAGLSKDWISGKLWANWDMPGTGFYSEVNAAYPLPQDFSFDVHVGYSFGDYTKGVDYSVGVSKAFGNISLSVKYVNSNDVGPAAYGRNAIVGSISTTLPWSAE